MAKSVMTLGNNDDLKLKAEQLIDEAYIRGHDDGKKKSTLHCWTTKEIEACEEIKNEAYQRGSEDAWKRIVDVRSKDIECGYNRGLNDAWELVKKLYFDSIVPEEVFNKSFTAVIKNITPQEAMQKIKDYERIQKWAEQAKRGKEHRDEIEKMLERKKTEPKYENCKKCRRLIELNDCHMEGCCGWYYYEPMNTKDNYVDAIIKVKVPKWQIGEKVNLYFKDTMSMDGICEADKK